MKKSILFIATIICSGAIVAQSRGGRGGFQSNENNSNINQLDNNVSNVYFNQVQTANESNVQQQVNFNPRNVDIATNRNVQINNVALENVQFADSRGNRDGDSPSWNNIPVSRGNTNVVVQTNDSPEVVQQQESFIPTEQQVVDNVGNDLALNVNPQINVPSINLNVDVDLDLNNHQRSDSEKSIDEKKDKDINIGGGLNLPNIDLDFNNKSATSKKVSTKKTKRTRNRKNHGYKQHVSIVEAIKSKSSMIKKLLKKKKSKKPKCLSVVCYQF